MSLYRLAPSPYSEAEWGIQIAKIRECILSVCSPTAIVLFGSGASGSRTAQSDIDMAVIVQNLSHAPDVRKKIVSVLSGEIAVDLLFFDEARFVAEAAKGGVAQVIRETGKLVFGKLPSEAGEQR